MKVSLITTVRNEEDTITDFLTSVLKQSKLPDEIVIVDGGSRDKTMKKISNFKFQISNVKLLLVKKRGNRSVGRNEAIRLAKGDIIAVTDVGCLLEEHWLDRIIKPFTNKKIDVVAGYYLPKTESVFEKSLAAYTCVMLDKVDPEHFLPSSRSVAFRKSVWTAAGGYPDALDYCEDLVFAKNLKQKGFTFTFARNALVFWPQRKNIYEAAKQFFNYAYGDGQARYFRPRTPLLFVRFFLGTGLFILSLFSTSITWIGIFLASISLYATWAIAKNYKYVKSLKALFWLPVLQVASDIFVFFGMCFGLAKSRSKRVIMLAVNPRTE